MSDAMTDIARDEERGRLYENYLKALRAFLKNPTKRNKKEVIEMAKQTDSVRGGYSSGETSLSKNIEAAISKLLKGVPSKIRRRKKKKSRGRWVQYHYHWGPDLTVWEPQKS